MENIVKKQRVRKSLSQKELAEKVNCTPQMIAHIEKGGKCSVKLAQKLGAILGFDWALLF